MHTINERIIALLMCNYLGTNYYIYSSLAPTVSRVIKYNYLSIGQFTRRDFDTTLVPRPRPRITRILIVPVLEREYTVSTGFNLGMYIQYTNRYYFARKAGTVYRSTIQKKKKRHSRTRAMCFCGTVVVVVSWLL